MHIRQHGFTLPHVLLVLLVLIGIAAAGFYVYTQQAEEPGADSTNITSFEDCVAAGNPVVESRPRSCDAGGLTFTEKTNDSIENADDETANWKTHEFVEVNASIKYPGDWSVSRTEDTVAGTYKSESFRVRSPDSPLGVRVAFSNKPSSFIVCDESDPDMYVQEKVNLRGSPKGQELAVFSVAEEESGAITYIVVAGADLAEPGDVTASPSFCFGRINDSGVDSDINGVYAIAGTYDGTGQHSSLSIEKFDGQKDLQTARKILETLTFD